MVGWLHLLTSDWKELCSRESWWLASAHLVEGALLLHHLFPWQKGLSVMFCHDNACSAAAVPRLQASFFVLPAGFDSAAPAADVWPCLAKAAGVLLASLAAGVLRASLAVAAAGDMWPCLSAGVWPCLAKAAGVLRVSLAAAAAAWPRVASAAGVLRPCLAKAAGVLWASLGSAGGVL